MPDALHLTLAFLGDVDPDRLASIERSIGLVARRHAAVTASTGRLGTFSRPGSARVLWYGVDDGEAALAALATDLGTVLGLDMAEPFRPHVTLARARQRSVDLRGWIEEASLSAPDGRVEATSVHLLRSHLGTGPARYERLASVRLAERA